MQTTATLNSSRIIRMDEACLKTGLCASTIYDLIARNIFPRPFQIVPGGRAVGWLEADLDQWVMDRKAASN